MLYCFISDSRGNMSFEKRMKQGENNFLKIIPHLKDIFPGEWFSTAGMEIDYGSGVDFIYVHLGQLLTMSVRVWEGKPRQWMSIRWKRTGDVSLKLEMESRLEDYRANRPLTSYTIEGWIYQNRIYVAIVPTKDLMKIIDIHFNEFSDFWCTNERDRVIFKRIPFDLIKPVKVVRTF